MRYIDVGGEHLSVIGVGTWQFGSRDWAYGDEYASTTAIDIVHRALDLGVNVLTPPRRTGSASPSASSAKPSPIGASQAWVASKLLPMVPPVGPGFIEGRPQVAEPSGHRRDRPVPSALAEPSAAETHTGGRAATAARDRRSPHRRQQLPQLDGRRSSVSSARRSCRTRCSTASPPANPTVSSCRSRSRTTGDHRLQPARARVARRQVRRRQRAPRRTSQQPAVPSREPRAGRALAGRAEGRRQDP